MKREILSFVVASAVVLAVFVAVGFLRGDEEKSAFASTGPEAGRDAGAFAYSASRKRALRNKISSDADAILSLSGRDVQQVLRAPELVRSDLPTVIWQYRTEACVLDLYFTSSKTDVSAARVVHYEARPRDSRDEGLVDTLSCVEQLAPEEKAISFFNVDIGAFYKSAAD